MKMMNPDAIVRYNNLKEQAEAICEASPAIHATFLPPRPERETAAVGIDIPLPVSLINHTVRNALTRLIQDCEMVMMANSEKGICFTFTISNIWTEEGE